MTDQNSNRAITQGESVTLKEHLEKQIASLETLLTNEISNMRSSVSLAKDDMEKRLDGMNEFRATLKDQSRQFVTRAELLAVSVGAATIASAVTAIIMRALKTGS